MELLKEVSVDGSVTFFDANDGASAAVGGGALYRITVKNTGTSDLENVVITDAAPPGGLGIEDSPVGNLAAGDSRVLTEAEIPALEQPGRCEVPGDVTNIATADGDSVDTGNTVSDSDPAVVRCAAPCLVIIDEDGVDNGMYTVEQAAVACGLDLGRNDELVNDQRHSGGPDVPTEGLNPPLWWNERVEQGECGAVPTAPPAITPATNPGRLALMPTGQRDDEGWFALPQRRSYQGQYVVAYADDGCTGADNSWTRHGLTYEAWIEKFWKGELRQDQLDKVCDVVPLRNQDLVPLVGKSCVAVVYDSDINMNKEPQYANLQGERYGLFSFKVEALEVVGPDSYLPETRSDTSLYALWLQILAPQQPGAPFWAKIHDHAPDTIQTDEASYASPFLTVRAVSDYPGVDTTPPYTMMMPATDGDDIAYMTVSADGADGGTDPDVAPFLLEKYVPYVSGQYQLKYNTGGENLDGRRLSIQTDEGGVYNVIIE